PQGYPDEAAELQVMKELLAMSATPPGTQQEDSERLRFYMKNLRSYMELVLRPRFGKRSGDNFFT
uniref:Pancreatic hormone n=2 Tax=Macrostomum lignano TaxID=282301 RepID=A0A1I8I774_9PLAT